MKIKMTKENYESIIDMWVQGENRDAQAVYHHSRISFSQVIDYSFDNNIIIDIETIKDTPFCVVKFKEELLEFKK